MKRITVQVWGNDLHGYTAYIPQVDITVQADTFDSAEELAVRTYQRHRRAKHAHPTPLPLALHTGPGTWTCLCLHANLPWRTDCVDCGSPLL